VDEHTKVLRGAAPGDATFIGDAPDPLIGRRLEARYEIVAPLARGGMATVYRAIDTRLDREVAVKIMHAAFAHDPDFVQRFEREAKAVARISHPNVVAVHDTGLDDASDVPIVFLVMELVRGRTLRDLIDERGKLTPGQALHILEPMLSALVAAHDAGLVHRDIKPENVLLADTGAVKVADFGLARAVEASSLTANGGLLLGTMAYLAPEQVTQGDADSRTDIYAAGIVLYEMLTGTVPYTAATPMAVAYQHVHETVPAPSSTDPSIPPAVDALVLRATARDAESRYPAAADFLVATRQAARGLPAATTPASPALRHPTMALPVTEQLTEAVPARGSRLSSRPAPTEVLPTAAPPVAPTAPGKRRRRRPPKWAVVLVILVLISAAAGVTAWWYGSGRYAHVPKVVGLTVEAAKADLSSHDLKPVDGTAEYSDTVAAGLVSSTTPNDGKRLVHGQTVVIHKSLGVEMVAVPTVQGVSLADARAAVQSAGFSVGELVHQNSKTVAAGTVITSNPAQGQSIKHGSAISLTVSDGPAPVTLPDLTGKPQDQAVSTLTGLGLTADPVTQDFSTTVPSGSVIRQNPPAGTAHEGDKIALVISKGPQLVAVPDLRGKTAASANAALAALGLKGEQVFNGGGVVVYQSPAKGVLLAPGSTVRFFTD
jgi:serine/threonine-protein kinase